MPKRQTTRPLTAKTARSARSGTREYTLWSEGISGFGFRVRKRTRNFLFRYRSPVDGKDRKAIIGPASMKFREAEAEAARMAGEVAQGRDPLLERQERAASQAKAAEAKTTVDQLWDRTLAEHYERKRAVGTTNSARSFKRLYLWMDQINKMAVSDVRPIDVERWHDLVSVETPGAADRALAVMSKAFTLAELWDLRDAGTNPCRPVERNQSKRDSPIGNPRERFLSVDEYKRTWEAIEEARDDGEDRLALAGILVILTIGLRHSEATTLRWENIHRDHFIATGKSGRRKVPMTDELRELLREIPRVSDSPWVFPNPLAKSGHYYSFTDCWQRIREAADVTDVTIHDLRCSFGVMAARRGVPLQDIAAILGHKSLETTKKYYVFVEKEVQERSAQLISRAVHELRAGPSASPSGP